jgi:YD repeat-containing protein
MPKHTRRSFLTALLAAPAALFGIRLHASTPAPALRKSPPTQPALNGTVSYHAYDAAGHLTQMRAAQGTVTTCVYDCHGNVRRVT